MNLVSLLHFVEDSLPFLASFTLILINTFLQPLPLPRSKVLNEAVHRVGVELGQVLGVELARHEAVLHSFCARPPGVVLVLLLLFARDAADALRDLVDIVVDQPLDVVPVDDEVVFEKVVDVPVHLLDALLVVEAPVVLQELLLHLHVHDLDAVCGVDRILRHVFFVHRA